MDSRHAIQASSFSADDCQCATLLRIRNRRVPSGSLVSHSPGLGTACYCDLFLSDKSKAAKKPSLDGKYTQSSHEAV